MPDIGVFHPQIVHFVVALLIAGVAFRLVALTGKVSFAGPAATVLLLAGTLAAVAAVKSGTDAHGPAERIPGARAAVMEHEEWGERTRNLFLGVAVLEIAALAFRRRAWHRFLLFGSAAVGVAGLFFIYETGEHGGHIVYSYAGGVGTRSGDPADVDRLLLAGLYQRATLDRREGKDEAAAELFAEMGRRFGDDPTVRFMAIESQLVDRHDPAAALTALETFTVPTDNRTVAMRVGLLRADAFVALEQPDSARAALAALLEAFPGNTRIADRLERLK
ncbi:MAG: hypothetical protein OEW56_03650 [Gemmatimonadota bacterium]|nr:hypothetical protein [Gemmatimonadota bacterium]